MFSKNPTYVVGIDVSDTTCEIVLLEKKNNSYTAHVRHRSGMPTGLISNGCIVDLQALSAHIVSVLESLSLSLKEYPCAWVLPQALTYTYVYTHRAPQRDMSREALVESVVRMSPCASDDVTVSFGEMSPHHDLMVVSSYHDISQWHMLASSICSSGYALYLEGYATAVGVTTDMSDPYVIIDIGGRSTVLTFIVNGAVVGISTLSIAGLFFTTQIAAALSLSFADAEIMKCQTKKVAARAPIVAPLSSFVSMLSERILASIALAEQKNTVSFGSVWCTGGTAQFPRLVEMLQKALHRTSISVRSIDQAAPEQYEAISALGAARMWLDGREHMRLFVDVSVAKTPTQGLLKHVAEAPIPKHSISAEKKNPTQHVPWVRRVLSVWQYAVLGGILIGLGIFWYTVLF